MNPRERAVRALDAAVDGDFGNYFGVTALHILNDAGFAVVDRAELDALRRDAKSRGPAYQRGRADGRLEQRASDGAVPAAVGERAPGPSGGGLVGPPAPEGEHVTRAQPFTDAELAADQCLGFGWFS